MIKTKTKVILFQSACILFLVLGNCKEKEVLSREPASLQAPNIILLMADDQGWGDIGYNGHPFLKTPNLDEMAANGATFSRFYAASAVCSPTRGSVMTGRHPLRYGICHANCGHIKQEEITLAEMVKERGYATAHFGKWHLGTLTLDVVESNRGGRPQFKKDFAPPWENGFDVCFVTESKVPTWNPMITPPKASGDVNGSLVEGGPFKTFYWTGPGKIAAENLKGDDSRIIMDRVLPFIENATQEGKPFLSIIWFHTPHLPVLTGEEHRKIYSGLSEGQQHYYGVLSAMDQQIGRLRDKIAQLGIGHSTILFYTSDNGPEGVTIEGRTQGSAKALRGRKRSLYEGGIRVPGIIEWHGKIKPGTKVQTPSFTSDYFPTIAQILNVDLKAYNRPYDGESLLSFVENPNIERRSNMAFSFQNQLSLIGEKYKIYSKDNGENFELYDILNDPSELIDISKWEPQIMQEMASELHQWKVSLDSSAQGNDYN